MDNYLFQQFKEIKYTQRGQALKKLFKVLCELGNETQGTICTLSHRELSVIKVLWRPSSTLAWKIPWTEKPGRLQSMGSRRVGHDRATSLSLFTFMHWRRKWQPTPVFLSGESQGRGSLVDCRLWSCTESDTTEVTQQQQQTRKLKNYARRRILRLAATGLTYAPKSWKLSL